MWARPQSALCRFLHAAAQKLCRPPASDAAALAREDRVRAEAERRGESIAATRDELIDGALDRLERERTIAADVILVTATGTELEELRKEARARSFTWKRQRATASTYYQLGEIAGQRVAAVRLPDMGSFSADGSAFTCHRIRAETSATSFIGVGMAFGIDETEQQVGDVLVSSSLFLYEEATVRDGTNGFEYVYDEPKARPRASARWLARFDRLRATGWGATDGVRLFPGALLAGSTCIESREYREHLRRRLPDGEDVVVGGEMEAAGLAAVCGDGASEWVIVKGVLDFATPVSRAEINQERRALAARNAARCALDALATMADER